MSLPLSPAVLAELFLSVPLFAGLAPDDAALLLAGAEYRVLADGIVLFDQDREADWFFIIMDGHVELGLVDGERASVVEVASRPAMVGEAALVVGGKHPCSGRVVGHAKVVAVPAAGFVAALEQRADLALSMLGMMSVRLRGLVGQIAQLKLQTTAQRLADFLLGLSDDAQGAARVRFPYDKKLAAELLGMSAESLSRALVRLAELGVESRADNLVMIEDTARLRAFCAEEGG